jgi:excisionase family DNA binding protein
MDKLLYRPKEATRMLGIGRDKLYDLMRSGRLHSVKDGRARFITAKALGEYVAMLEAEARKAA